MKKTEKKSVAESNKNSNQNALQRHKKDDSVSCKEIIADTEKINPDPESMESRG
jgi:hypothetical protein